MFETKQQITQRKIRNGIRKERDRKERDQKEIIDILSNSTPLNEDKTTGIRIGMQNVYIGRRTGKSMLTEMLIKNGSLSIPKFSIK